MKKHYAKCPGRYCNVYLEEGVNAHSKIKGVLNKSLFLDTFEASENSADDPLALGQRNYLTLDALMQKMPKLRPSNFYNTRKACKNCQLAYSIIDNQRLKNLKFPLIKNKNLETEQSFSNMQTKLGYSTEKFLANIDKYKKRLQDKKVKEYHTMKTILIPVGHTRMSQDARHLLSKMIPNGYDSEEDDIMPIIKETKTTNFFQSSNVCELAKSIIDKSLMERRNSRRLIPSKTLPHVINKKMAFRKG
jgi:hypothetical protein